MDAKTLDSIRTADAKFHLHPFTNHDDMHRAGTHVVTGSSGVYVTDQDNRQLLDGLAGLWCVNVGYGRKEIAEAVYKQMLEVPYYPSFFNTTTEPAVHLAEKLAAIAPRRIKRSIF